MRRFAGLFLISGLLSMILVFGVAVVAMPYSLTNTMPPPPTLETCIYCHADAHTEFMPEIKIQSSHLLPTPEATTEVPLCTTCHSMTTEENLPLDLIEARLTDVQQRVNTLQEQLDQIEIQNPGWDHDTAHKFKTNQQITAERIATLVTFIESDGSWGFHDPTYTEEILTEAENLMQILLGDH